MRRLVRTAIMNTCYVVPRYLLLVFLGLSLLTANQKTKPKPGVAAAPASKDSAGNTIDPKSYVIGPEDILQVRVWRDAEVSAQVTVRPDGKITLQLLGDIHAAGDTAERLTQVIFDGLSKLKTIDRSEVTVSVVEVRSKKYYIQGEVLKPGAFSLHIPTTVLEALVNAGGFRDFANQKKIVVLRHGERLKFNYKDVVKGKHMEQNIQLQPGDLIMVP